MSEIIIKTRGGGGGVWSTQDIIRGSFLPSRFLSDKTRQDKARQRGSSGRTSASSSTRQADSEVNFSESAPLAACGGGGWNNSSQYKERGRRGRFAKVIINVNQFVV